MLMHVATLRCMVLDLDLHQHVFEDYPYCASKAYHPHDRSIRLRLGLVHGTGCSGQTVSAYETDNAIPQVWHSPTTQGDCRCDTASYCVYDRRPHLECGRDIKDTCVAGAYHQGTVAPHDSFRLPLLLWHHILRPHIPLPNTSHS